VIYVAVGAARITTTKVPTWDNVRELRKEQGAAFVPPTVRESFGE
jgi:hypothetical protein